MLRSLANTVSAHPRRTLLLTLAFVVVAGAIGGPLAGSLKSSGGFAPPNSDSQVATRHAPARQRNRAGPRDRAAGEHARAGPPPPRGADRGAQRPPGGGAGRGAHGGARRRRPRRPPRADHRHAGGHAPTTRASAKAAVAAFAHDRDVTVGGPAVADEQISSTVTADLGFAELLAFPLLIVLSILFFRGRAALMPLAVGVTTVLGTFLVLTGVNHVYGLSIFALNLVIGMGLGLAVDYTLFLVTRFRQELAAGSDVGDAIATTMMRAGRTVLFSAVTVACALATLTLFPQGFLKSMGIAGAATAIVAAVVAVTVSPALLAPVGRQAGAPRRGRGPRPLVSPRPRGHAPARHRGRDHRGADGGGGAAGAEHGVVLGQRQLGHPDRARARARWPTRWRADFAGAGRSPVTVAVRAPASDRAAVDAYAHRIAAIPGVQGVTPPRLLGDATWQINAPVAGDSAGATAQRVVNRIRAISVPFTAKVTGDAATFVDQQNAIGVPPAGGDRAAGGAHVRRAVADDRLGRAARQGDPHERAHRGRGAHPAGAHLPARQPHRPARLHLRRRRGAHRLRRRRHGRVRPLHGLRRVPARAHQGGARGQPRATSARRWPRAWPPPGASSPRRRSCWRWPSARSAPARSPSSRRSGWRSPPGVLLDAFIVRSLLVPSLMALLGRWNWWSPAGCAASTTAWRRTRPGVAQPGRRRVGRAAGLSAAAPSL